MSRSMPQTTRCADCNRILVNNAWVAERREYFVRYQATLCPQCAAALGPVRAPLSPGAARSNAPLPFRSPGG